MLGSSQSLVALARFRRRPECGKRHRLLIVGRRQLEHVIRDYVEHYNRERPHRALELRPPDPSPRPIPLPPNQTAVRRRDRLGGLIHEYARAA